MKTPQTKQKGRGFTIIEVMIVLTIAGLILLIVFLAVPALQRSSRNTQRKNDVSSLLSAANEFVSNNSGQVPTGATWAAPNLTLTGANGTTSSQAKLGYYAGVGGGQGNINTATGAQAALPQSAANDRVLIVTGAQCGNGGATVAGSARQIAAQYLIENGSGSYAPQCQEG